MTRGHIWDLQSYFLDQTTYTDPFRLSNIITPFGESGGNFLSFDLKSTQAAKDTVQRLSQRGVSVDSRGSALRIGFGIYHDRKDVDGLMHHIRTSVSA